MKIYGFRYQIIGDMVMALTMPYFFETLYPNSFKYWGIAKKVAHAAPIFINHPYINQIHIQDGLEGPESHRDFELINKSDIIINGNPSHPDDKFPNQYDIYSETWRMAGLDIKDYNALPKEHKYPKLYKWFKDETRPSNHGKIIALFPQGGYGKEPKRGCSKEYYEKLLIKLIGEGYGIIQFGHSNDMKLFDLDYPEGNIIQGNFKRLTHLDFFHQIRLALSCDLILSTDSGSGVIFAAYGAQQINFISAHWPGHNQNYLALAPQGENTYNFFGQSCDDIIQGEVINKIKEKLS